MPRLIIYIPFSRNVQGELGDLRTNAKDLVQQTKKDSSINKIEIKKVISIFAGEEQANSIQNGDILIIHAHGGPDDTSMGDNLGENINMDKVNEKLIAMGSANAAQVFFCACYSAQKNHIARVWKAAHKGQMVRGATGVVQGAIAQITRGGTIRNAMFFTNDPRMQTM